MHDSLARMGLAALRDPEGTVSTRCRVSVARLGQPRTTPPRSSLTWEPAPSVPSGTGSA
jgi:hypothetical protein